MTTRAVYEGQGAARPIQKARLSCHALPSQGRNAMV